MDLDKEIERAVTRVAEKRRELHIAERAQSADQITDRKMQLRIAERWLFSLRCRKADIRIGDVVRSTLGGSEKPDLYRVVEINFSELDPDAKPWVRADPRRADGSWGRRTRNLYDEWAKVDPEKGET